MSDPNDTPTEAPKKQVRINVPIPQELHRDLKVKAAQEGLDLQELIPALLRAALQPKESRTFAAT